ncbi:MAG: CBS domain-containing protein [Acidobacteria bacterium]|nr:MAG: CBS domain-containing protein [Acidobacteriota bacterium]
METLLVRDLMTRDVVAVGPAESLATLRDVMLAQRVRHMPVVDPAGRLIGLVSQRDLLRNQLVEQAATPDAVERAVLERLAVSDLMGTSLVWAEPDDDIRDAAQRMLDHQYGCLPVVEEGRLVGILTESDFVRLFARGQ